MVPAGGEGTLWLIVAGMLLLGALWLAVVLARLWVADMRARAERFRSDDPRWQQWVDEHRTDG